VSARPAAIIGVVGAGTMGAGIAQVAATAGHPVLIYDVVPGAAEESLQNIQTRLARLTEKGKLDEDQAQQVRTRLVPAAAIVDLGECGLVVEAVVEDITVKRELFGMLEVVCRDDALLASNTSSLSITDIGAGLLHPKRFAGMHFFNPAPLLPLVEIVSGNATSATAADTLAATARAWGKTPVQCTSTPGFIVNRVARPFYAEAFRVLGQGMIDPATLDAIMCESGGFRMGPCELTDLIGQDVNAEVTRSIWKAFDKDPRFEPSALQDVMVADGRLGHKSGGGFFDGTAKPAAATAAPCTAPQALTVNGGGTPLSSLVARLDRAGFPARATRDLGPVRIRPSENVVLQLTDGRTATDVIAETGETTILIDVAHDFATASRFAIAAAPGTPTAAVSDAVGCLQAAGADVTIVADTPGMIVARIVSMLAAFGADAVDAGVASGADVDTAMKLGVNYPKGPLAWGDDLGWDWVTGVLDELARTEDAQRYRVSDDLRKRAVSGYAAEGAVG
jgi:3-hydroxybutyryl-CoA dehydrogenase